MDYLGKLFCKSKIISTCKVNFKKECFSLRPNILGNLPVAFFLSFGDIFLVPFMFLVQRRLLAVSVWSLIQSSTWHFLPPIVLGIPFALHKIEPLFSASHVLFHMSPTTIFRVAVLSIVQERSNF